MVVDAPLLFEAGIDRECDAVVFVDCPREERLARVKSTRGWDEDDLTRREAAQWPLERKRAACGHVIHNSRDRDDVERQVRAVLASIMGLRGRQ
jgi:dephospho-CoA kinase